MINNDGALSFDAMIKDSQFNKSIMEMERRIRGLSDSTVKETSNMDKSFQRLSIAIAGYFSADAIAGFVTQMTTIRGEFQQLEIAFETMLGSKEKADQLMAQVIDLAAKTPFGLQDAAQGAKQLLAYGTASEDVIDTLTRLGDIASGLSVPMNDLVYLYGTTMTQGRLYTQDLNQFTGRGIPMIKELAKQFGVAENEVKGLVEAGKVGFPEVEKVIQNLTNEGGMFAGLMEKQSASLTGLIAQFQDAVEVMFNDLGESQEGFLADAILTATASVENYEKILDVLKVIILTFGAYKAAVIAASVAQTVFAASSKGVTVGLRLQYAALVLAEGAQKLLNRTMLANPYVLAATLLVGLVTSLRAFSKTASAAEKSQESLSNAMKRADEAATSEISKIKILQEQINNESLSRQTRNEKLQELIKLSPEYLNTLTLDSAKTEEGTKAINGYIEALKRKLQLQELETELQESLQRELDAENMENSATIYDQFTNALLNFNNESGRMIADAKDRVKANRNVVQSEKEVQKSIMERINAITESGEASKTENEETQKAVIKNVAYYDEEIAALKKKQKEQSKTAEEYKKFQAEINQLEKEREAITGEAAAKQAKKDANTKKKTFDEELEYKKKQYELYYKWVSYVGKNAADKEFEDLLKRGKSYSEYLKSQIQALEPKVLNQTATQEERKQYSSLNIQYDDITGAKSAMDVFKESISDAKNEAQTLIEYLDKLKEIKEDLGESDGLLGDDLNEATRIISEEETDTDKQIQDDLLERYRSYEQKRLDIAADYDRQITYMRSIGEEERAKIAEKERDKLISSISVDEMMNDDSWKNLFGNLDELTVQQIDTLIKEIEDKFESLSVHFDPIDLNAIRDKLNEARDIILKDNPFKAVGEAIKGVFNEGSENAGKSADQIKKDWKDLATSTEAAFDFVTNAISSAEFLKDAIGEVGSTAIASLSSVAAVSISVAAAIKTAEKASVILAIVQAALVAVQAIANVFKSVFQRHDRKLQKQIDQHKSAVEDLELAYQGLDRAINQALGSDIYRKQQQAIDNLEQQRRAVIMAQQAERDKKKSDSDKLREYDAQLIGINNRIEDITKDISASILQTDAKQFSDQLADAIVSAYSKGEDAAKAFEEVSRNVMQNAVKNALKLQFLEKPIQKAIEQLQNDMGSFASDGSFVFDGLSKSEQQKFKDTVANIGSGFGEALKLYDDLFKELDLGASDPFNALEGSIKGITEETASILAGNTNAIRVNQMEAISLIRQQLMYMLEIATNTRYNKHLESIDKKLDKLGSNPLDAKGVL
ncbi:tape measure protein [Albibacterium profundi]|uniref:Tape measure protein n=1 Tax=Albibacterium profundi TaxID=3134906 RepID=A0ABV5CF02_9SPHI